MGPPGTVQAGRAFLAEEVSLKDVAQSGPSFPSLLDDLTHRLKRTLPVGGDHWGAARKFLNIFLRDALYNYVLRDAFDLQSVESYLEIPVDRQVAIKLQEAASQEDDLPKWQSVISLDASLNAKYQNIAGRTATTFGISRVHLDLLYWRGGALKAFKSVVGSEYKD
jgi:hypothetical protein